MTGAVCVSMTVASAAALEPRSVKRTQVPETAPAADGAWFAWARTLSQEPGTWPGKKYFVQRGTDRRSRVNARGSYATGGGIDGRTLVYAQWPADSTESASDLYRFDLRTHRRSPFPRKVNTANLETNASVSGRWLLFERRTFAKKSSGSQVLLYDRRSGRLRLLAGATTGSATDQYAGVSAGQVNGRYSVWDSREGVFGTGIDQRQVVRFDVRTGTRTVIAAPDDPAYGGPQSPAVSADGTVYYVRQPTEGGTAGDEVLKQPPSGPVEVITTLADGHHASDLFVDDRANGAHRIYYVAETAGPAWSPSYDDVVQRDVARLVDRTS